MLPTYGLDLPGKKIERMQRQSEKRLQQAFITPQTLLKALALKNALEAINNKQKSRPGAHQ